MRRNEPGNSDPVAPHLILASTSPRRAAILKQHGYSFEVVAPPEDDPSALPRNLSPAQFASYLSAQKARVVAQRLGRGLILAGDTVAALGDEIFGKPIDRSDAERILRVIAGTAHEVTTALTLLDATLDREMTWHDTTTVIMRDLTEVELSDYLDAGAWKGKAGAYGIQDHGDAFVQRIEGSFTNVVGLPVEMLTRMLGEWAKTGM